jgi:hypothetical protein
VFPDLLGFGLVIPFPAMARRLGGRLRGDLGAAYPHAVRLHPDLGPVVGPDRRRPVLLGHRRDRRRHGVAGRADLLCSARARLSGIATTNIAVAQAYVADVTPPRARHGIIGIAFGPGSSWARHRRRASRFPVLGAGDVALLGRRAGAVNFLALATLPESLPPAARDAARDSRWTSGAPRRSRYRDRATVAVNFAWSLVRRDGTDIPLFTADGSDVRPAATSSRSWAPSVRRAGGPGAAVARAWAGAPGATLGWEVGGFALLGLSPTFGVCGRWRLHVGGG